MIVAAFFIVGSALLVRQLEPGDHRASLNTLAPERLVITQAEPATVHLNLVRKGDRGQLISVAPETRSSVAVTVPVAWQVFEIVGRRLDQIDASSAGNGYRLWRIASGSTMTFFSRESRPVTVRNDAPLPLLLEFSFADLTANTQNRRSILIPDELTLP